MSREHRYLSARLTHGLPKGHGRPGRGSSGEGSRGGRSGCRCNGTRQPTLNGSARPHKSFAATPASNCASRIQAGDAARQAAAKADEARRKAEAKEKEFVDKIERLKTELAKVA